MSISAAETSSPQDLTPSEIVLLRCDCLAPPPPQSRLRFEFSKASGYLAGMFIATALLFLINASNTDADLVLPGRIVAGLVDLALPAIWWYRRRGLDPRLDRDDIQIVLPLAGDRPALFPDIVQVTLAAALLAHERAGSLQFDQAAAGLVARFHDSGKDWPVNSLEDRLRRARPVSVQELVHDWLADGSNFPLHRALRLIEHGARLRGISSSSLASTTDAVDPAPVEAMLRNCREGRPEIWKALQAGIAAGIASRTVPPTMVEVGGGRARVPKFDYQEIPVSALDAPADPIPGNGISIGVAKPEDLPKVARTGTMVAVAAVFVCATLITVMKFHSENGLAAALTGGAVAVLLQILVVTAGRTLERRKALRKSYGLTPDPATMDSAMKAFSADHSLAKTVASNVASAVMLGAISALPVAIWGPGKAFYPLAVVGLFWLINRFRLSESLPETAAEVVAARVRMLAMNSLGPAAAAAATGSVTVGTSVGAGPQVPDQPTAAQDLPAASPEAAELLERWSRRRASFRRLYWISLAVLIGGYTLIVLAFWCTGARTWIDASEGVMGNIPVALIFTLVPTGMLLIGFRANGAGEDEKGDSRHAFAAGMIALWRGIILIEAPLLFSVQHSVEAKARSPYFAITALLFLAAHWLWMERTLAGAMRDLPLPKPRRLVMLRVFGSPAFDDLVALFHPWLRVGTIEHLEGYDTVGLRSDVQAAVDAGKVDDALVKDMDEVRTRLAEAGTEPDSALLFQRHAFQCTDASWRGAIQLMLDRADAVLMDLSSLSDTNQGCAWELGQLLDRVPLSRVTLLVNDSTDLVCLRRILNHAVQQMSRDSPNRNNPAAAWQQVRIGGLAARQPKESFFDWRRRQDSRLDPMQLAAWMISTARPPASAGPPVTEWARQARWRWLVLLALSAAWGLKPLLGY